MKRVSINICWDPFTRMMEHNCEYDYRIGFMPGKIYHSFLERNSSIHSGLARYCGAALLKEAY